MQGGEGIAALTCVGDSDCKAHGVRDGASLECTGSADCDFKADGPATAVCQDSADCKVEVGDGGVVRCLDAANCDIKCTGTDCDILCDTTGSCEVKCGPSEEAAIVCEDGTVTCGTC